MSTYFGMKGVDLRDCPTTIEIDNFLHVLYDAGEGTCKNNLLASAQVSEGTSNGDL
jgi:hypothetical protein